MNLTQNIIVNNQLYAKADVKFGMSWIVNEIEKIVVSTVYLYTTGGVLIKTFDDCYAQIEENSIYKGGTTTAQTGAYNTYKAAINSSPADFYTLLGSLNLGAGYSALSYYIT